MSGIGYAYFMVLALINDGSMKQSYYTIYIHGALRKIRKWNCLRLPLKILHKLLSSIAYRRSKHLTPYTSETLVLLIFAAAPDSSRIGLDPPLKRTTYG